jgi:two-component sensor histidine kinase
MGLQERREINPVAKLALHAATARILAVARIHDALQLTGGNDLVDLGALLKTMCRTLHEMAGDAASVNVTVDAISLQAPIALAQPSVLAVNELIVNALRHAFVGRESGAIHVSLVHLQGELRIVVADDGRGLPDDYLQGHGYGLKLVRTMIAKIGGTLEVESKNGARFTLTAPTPAVLAV